ncbi:MAG TPA: DmsC/YnfH family molybdoenzyme membrane anchor subunit [Usitatibacter sp.]|nr:DmsC/YnfH family molybdoenzyme membrane anchor subunit [Usitatibacter sp.]
MRPAWSVVFLTTLIGAAQGLFLAVYAGALHADARFAVAGAIVAVVLAALGLLASFFHLGRPERAWRSAAKWRTSWLSREVIALPAFMALAAAYALAMHQGFGGAMAIGAVACAAAAALFVCTAMIYACIRFLQEWASGFTLANFVLMGCASGLTLAVPLASVLAPGLAGTYALAAVAATLAALAVRAASLARNARIVRKSTIQSAIGIHHPVVEQRSQGFTASAFNTREFFHGVSHEGMRRVRITFLLLAFVLPVALVLAGMKAGSLAMLCAAVLVQYAGLVAERWFFLAQATHPQNLYYQRKA